MEGTLLSWKGLGCEQMSVTAFKAPILPKLCISCCCSCNIAHWTCCFALQSCLIPLLLQRTHGLNSFHLTRHVYLRHPVSPSVVVDPIYNRWKYMLSSRGLFKAHIWSSKPTFLVLILRLAAKPASRETCEWQQRELWAQQCCCMVLCKQSCHAWRLHMAGSTREK